ncbi:hypothetical protein [Paraburkholderia adhaesiva]|uniref:hypothetical protein n=1 Tax=Paraburkholderia adhaesiva TaxID=2883244 RepID=UPI001F208784|nr:hypothetical protein [Paraburkholderia adhaesiva]
MTHNLGLLTEAPDASANRSFPLLVRCNEIVAYALERANAAADTKARRELQVAVTLPVFARIDHSFLCGTKLLGRFTHSRVRAAMLLEANGVGE